MKPDESIQGYENRKSQDSHKNQYHSPVLGFGFQNHNTVAIVDQICRWSAISLPLVTHTEDTVLPARSSDSCSSGLVLTSYHVSVS